MHSKSWIQSSYYIRRNYRYSASCFSLFSVQNLNKPDDFKLLARKVEMKCSDLQTKVSIPIPHSHILFRDIDFSSYKDR